MTKNKPDWQEALDRLKDGISDFIKTLPRKAYDDIGAWEVSLMGDIEEIRTHIEELEAQNAGLLETLSTYEAALGHYKELDELAEVRNKVAERVLQNAKGRDND